LTRKRIEARHRLEEPADLEAYGVRFQVFLRHASQSSIAVAAFDAFEVAIETACMYAAMSPEVGPDFDDNEDYYRELESLRPIVGDMMFKGLEEIDVAYMIQYADGFGSALRYGLLDVHVSGLADVQTQEYVALATEGRRSLEIARQEAMREAVEGLVRPAARNLRKAKKKVGTPATRKPNVRQAKKQAPQKRRGAKAR
jgi:hypothetical protein